MKIGRYRNFYLSHFIQLVLTGGADGDDGDDSEGIHDDDRDLRDVYRGSDGSAFLFGRRETAN